MKYSLTCCFFFLSLLLPSLAKDFRVYAPASKSNTLWIILVKSNESGDTVQMEIEQKVDLGFAGRVITAHPTKPLLYVSAAGGETGQVPGAVISLSDKGTYQKHERVAFNDGACFLSL
ncbi:MAG: hypothetical protein GY899_13655, partial [Verrucomicrobiaceae bacterium]|nr:hypothetical protein [Verrucomicrobiaceae bacterium]